MFIEGNGRAVMLLHSEFVSKYQKVDEEEVVYTALYRINFK
jgi:hypothetical protein